MSHTVNTVNLSDAQILTELVRLAPAKPRFLKNTFGANPQYSNIPGKVKMLVQTEGSEIAQIGRIGDEPNNVKRISKVREEIIEAGQIFEYTTVDEDQIFSNAIPQNAQVWGGAGAALTNKEYIRSQNALLLRERYENALNDMIAKLLSTGGYTYQVKNDAGKVLREFSYASGVTADDYTLTKASTDVYNDFIDIVDEMKLNGFAPDYIFITRDIEKALFDTTKFVDHINKTKGFEQALLNVYSPSEVRQTFTILGMPPMYVYDGFLQEGVTSASTGTRRKLIDSADGKGKIIFASKAALQLSYAGIAREIPKFAGVTDLLSWEMPDPWGNTLNQFLESRPLWYLKNTSGLKILNATIA